MGLGRSLILISISLCQIASPRSSKPKSLANLGMLEGTKISASSVNGNREIDNPYYGAFNLFDGGENRINNLNYTSWLTDSESRHWVKLQFDAPMEVDSIMLELPGKAEVMGSNPTPMPAPNAYSCATFAAASPRPTEFAVDLTTRRDGTIFTHKLPSIEVTGFRLYYPLEEPAQNVTEVTVVFPGPSSLEVSELEVMGVSSKPGEALRPRRGVPLAGK